MNPVSNTAYYCCGVRMQDAEREHSICHDIYAKRFMDAYGMAIFEPFATAKMANACNTARCKIIDDLLRDEIKHQPNTQIISIGCGFDSRPYRIKGGHWVEIDEPQIMQLKEEKLPNSECHNSLTRIAINFAQESLAEKLQTLAKNVHTVFVIEGVLMYLGPEAIQANLTAMQQVFPKHVVICDLMTKRFFDHYAYRLHEKLVSIGASFTERPEQPAQAFLDHDYQLNKQQAIMQQAAAYGLLQQVVGMPKWLAEFWLWRGKKSVMGYAIYYFTYGFKLRSVDL